MLSSTEERRSVPFENAHRRIQDLAASCGGHAALNNGFYERWQAGALTADQVELIARNFYEHVAPTPNRIALALVRMTDAEARAETAENINDELGHGDASRAHALILRNYLEGLLSRLRGRPVSYDELTAPLLPTTLDLVTKGAELFGSEENEIGCGALLAQEWHAYPQLVYLYEGARNYLSLYDLAEFHESCEYFYLHIGAAEKEHKANSLATAARICRTEEQLKRLEYGFNAYLDLLADYWRGLDRALDQTQPA